MFSVEGTGKGVVKFLSFHSFDSRHCRNKLNIKVTVTNLWKKLIKQKFTHIHCKDSVLSSRCRTYYSRNLNARCLRPEHLVVHSGHYETAKEEEETENEYLNPCTMQTPKLKVEKHPVK